MTATAALKEFDGPMLDALFETMFLAAYADGEFSAEERKHFAEAVESLTDRRLMGAAFEAMLARLEGANDDDRAARLISIKARLPSLASRKVAFTLAVNLVASDGIIRTTERELLFEIADALEIDRDEAADLVKVGTR